MGGVLVLVTLIGVGLEKPNEWAFDTAQFDSILKRLKVVMHVFCFFIYAVYVPLLAVFSICFDVSNWISCSCMMVCSKQQIPVMKVKIKRS